MKQLKSDPVEEKQSDGPVTMAEIARIAGVAESTVSRALAGSNRVSAETKTRIREIVRSSGYRVNERARSLRTQKTHTVEVVIAISDTNRQHFSDPFFSQLISSIADALAQRGFDLLLSRIPPWKDKAGADAVSVGRADGVIFIGQGRSSGELAEYASRNGKIVVWGAQLPGQSYCVVGSDNRLGGELVGRHLLKLGRRRVAFLGDVRHVEVGLRHAGCMEALAAAGAPTDQTLTVSMPFDSASAYAATRRIIERGVWHDAIFAASDVIAMAAIQALHDAGLQVPQDVAVVGYDDVALAAYVSPALTTVRQDVEAGGKALVERLVALTENRPVESLTLPTELVVRRSCGESI